MPVRSPSLLPHRRAIVATVAVCLLVLGILLAMGRPPFRVNPTDTAEEIEARTLAADPPDLAEVGVPPALAVAVTAAMAKDPADRPTMRELRTRLLWATRDPERHEPVGPPDGEQTAGRDDLIVIHSEVYKNPKGVADLSQAELAPLPATYDMLWEPSLFVTDAANTIVARGDIVVDRGEMAEMLALAV